LATGCAARAAELDELLCRNGAFSTEQAVFSLAKVTGRDRLFFLDDMNGCPSEEAQCRQRGFVVMGDMLLTGRSQGPYICAFYPNRGGGSAGWVRRDRLAPLPFPTDPPLTAWAGRWVDGDDTIKLTVKNGALVAVGDAYWPSANPPRSYLPGDPHVGNLSGKAQPKGNCAIFSDGDPDDCTATLTLVDPLLVVGDNGACGGMNVTFNGIYRQRANLEVPPINTPHLEDDWESPGLNQKIVKISHLTPRMFRNIAAGHPARI
jgi:hypothetical protein